MQAEMLTRESGRVCALGKKQTIVRFFPHEARDLEPAIALLTASDASRGAAGEDEDGAGAWEVRPHTAHPRSHPLS